MSPNQRPSIIPDAHTIETLHHVQSSSILETRTTTEKEPESTTSLNNEKNEPNKTANRARESSCRVCLKSFKPDDFSKTCYECKYRVCEDCASYSKMVMYCSLSHHRLSVSVELFDKQWNALFTFMYIPLQSFIFLNNADSLHVYRIAYIQDSAEDLVSFFVALSCVPAYNADVCVLMYWFSFSVPHEHCRCSTSISDEQWRRHHHEFLRIPGAVVFVVERCLQEYASLKILLTPI